MPRQTRLFRMFTVLLLFRTALRMRVSMSAIGSVEGIREGPVVLGSLSGLPAGLAHPGDLALEGELPQHDAADAELAVDAPGPPGELAPAHHPGAELRLPPALGHLRFGRHGFAVFFFSAAAPAGAAAGAAPGISLFSRVGRGSSGLAKGKPICSSTKRL